MTEATKIKRKPGRKSNAEKAAILAAQEQARAGESDESTILVQAEPDGEGDQRGSSRGDDDSILPRGALSVHERQGLINEALYVHEMQEATARYDSFNRRWAFRPTSINYVASLTIECKKGPDKREVSISNARFGAENVIEDVKAAIDLLDEAMA